MGLTEDEEIYVEGDIGVEVGCDRNYYCWEPANLDLADFELKTRLMIFFVLMHKATQRRFRVKTVQIPTGELCFGHENKILRKKDVELRYQAVKNKGLVTLEIKIVTLSHFDLGQFISGSPPVYCCYLNGVCMGVSMEGEWTRGSKSDDYRDFIFGKQEIYFNKQAKIDAGEGGDVFWIHGENLKVEIYNVNVIPARLELNHEFKQSKKMVITAKFLTRRGLFVGKGVGFAEDRVEILEYGGVRVMVGVGGEVIYIIKSLF